jgi:hypothetical protein
MRDVEVSRFVRASPQAVERALTPAAVVEYEGSFAVRDVEERDGTTYVTVGSRGLEFVLRFDPREDGVHYEQEGEAGPFEAMTTTVSVRAEDDGSRVTARSSVSLGLPVPFADRVAAWKRRGELKRALSNLDASV